MDANGSVQCLAARNPGQDFEAASDAAVDLMANVTTNNGRYTRYLQLVER